MCFMCFLHAMLAPPAQVDLQFTAVEWLGLEGRTRAGSDGSAAWAPWAASPRAAERAATG